MFLDEFSAKTQLSGMPILIKYFLKISASLSSDVKLPEAPVIRIFLIIPFEYKSNVFKSLSLLFENKILVTLKFVLNVFHALLIFVIELFPHCYIYFEIRYLDTFFRH